MQIGASTHQVQNSRVPRSTYCKTEFKMRLAQKQLSLLARLPHSATRLEGDRRAVVAALCRRGAADSGLEVLFIVRATHPASRWSGQVGFPGGHVEAGESDAQAVAREVEEEVGLHISRTKHYRYIGEVQQRRVQRGHGSLIVCCHVFEQTVRESHAATSLQTSEVAACAWIPLTVLTADMHVAPLKWSEQAILDDADVSWDGFPSVRLQTRSDDDRLLVAPMGGLAGCSQTQLSDAFQLWGLTLSIVNDWLISCGLRQVPIDSNLLAARQQQQQQACASRREHNGTIKSNL